MFLSRNNIILSLKVKLLQRKKSFFFLRKLKKKFPQSQIYLIGGAVRDLLLSHSTQDYDFVVRNIPLDALRSFLSQYGSVNLVGETFGVLKFTPNEVKPHHVFDIALPRKDFSFKTGGYRDVRTENDPKLSIEEDLSRRDFTINAMAIEIHSNPFKKNILIDPQEGYKDLEERVIKTVGQPEERFKEDYSRILRGIRFACQLNFEIENMTWEAMKDKMSCLLSSEKQVVPYEVIAKEFLKSFASNPLKAFDLYDKSGAFQELIPELLKMKGCPQPNNWHSEGDVWAHTRLALQSLYSSKFYQQFKTQKFSLELILSILFHDIGKPYTIQTPEKDKTDRIRFNEHDTVGGEITKKICQRLKLSSPENVGVNIDNIVWLVSHHMLLSQGRVKKMKASTIEKYFFNSQKPGLDLLKLSFVDILATVPPSGKPNFSDFNQMVQRINSLKSRSYNQKSQNLPQLLVNGDEIMQELNLSPGPGIGKLLDLVREEQLNGHLKNKKQAFEFLKSVYDKSKQD
ncbi:CCA tRNA nucleotidyltransferase [bacterium]|nr:CCA tRNA nucleotidyltransferase [bacterium]